MDKYMQCESNAVDDFRGTCWGILGASMAANIVAWATYYDGGVGRTPCWGCVNTWSHRRG